MSKTTNTMRINALENDVKAIRGEIADLNTAINRLCDLLEPKATKPTTAKKNAGTKSVKKAAKPTTRKEALAKWEADKGITAESKAEYKAYYAREYAARWDKWTASKERNNLKGEALKRRNREKSAQNIADIKRDWSAMNA